MKRTLLVTIWVLACSLSLYGQSSPINVQNITIVRDSFGVPHIYAPTDAEAAYGLAWAHAEDNFDAILRNLLMGKGRLGEMLGPEGAKMDFFAQWVRARQQVETRWETDLTPQYRAVLNGYAAGLTAYAHSHPDEVPLRNLLPFTAQDVATGYTAAMCALVGGASALEAVNNGRQFYSLIELGSNAFVANSAATADGGTYFDTDSHWLLDGTLTFWEAHVNSQEGWNMLGALYPGMPSMILGTNGDIAWSVPFSFADYVDVYELTLNPQNKNQYRIDGQWRDFERSEARLKAKVAGIKIGVKRELLWSIYGPAFRLKDGRVFAFAMNSLHRIDAGQTFYEMNRSHNLSQFRAALNRQTMPLFHFLYADRFDSIYYTLNGLYPVRNPAFNFISNPPGDTSATVWQGFHPPIARPEVINPPNGMLFNTNCSPFYCTPGVGDPLPANYPANAGFGLNPINDRAIRANSLLADETNLTYERFRTLAMDLETPTFDADADTAYPHLLIKTFRRLDTLNINRYPELRAELEFMRANYRTVSGRTEDSTTSLIVVTALKLYNDLHISNGVILREGLQCSEEQLIEAITFAKKWLKKHYGRTTVPFGEVQRIERGGVSAPGAGLVETLRSGHSNFDDRGFLKVYRTSAYQMFVRFGPDNQGITDIRSIMPYGNSSRPDSPHYTDQMQIMTQFGHKQMTLDEARIRVNAVRTYHPGGLPRP